MKKFLGVCFIALVFCPSVLFSQLKLPAIFSDNMVIQRDKPVPVWGWADTGAEVTVEFAGQKKTATADTNGSWRVILEPKKANSKPQVMTIRTVPPKQDEAAKNVKAAKKSPIAAGPEEMTIKNVLVGDVWLCSGQSNMEMPVGYVSWTGGALNYEEEINKSANPLLRQFNVVHDFRMNRQTLAGTWSAADKNTTSNFSATGYFFAREIQKSLKIPVAIITAAVGATPIEAWISREKLLSDPHIADLAAKQAVDVTVGGKRRNAEYLVAHAAWREKYGRIDPGAPASSNAMAAVTTDTSDWNPVTIPGSSLKVGARHGGITWFRREVEMPAADTDGLWITLPGIRDFLAVYFNGVKLLTTSVDQGRRLLYAAKLPKHLINSGKNVLAIRLQTYSGAGTIGGRTEHFRISKSHVGGNNGIPLAGEWLCKVETEYAPYPKGAEREPTEAPGIGVYYHYTSGWFDHLIAPLAPYSVAGFVWYQGEHNGGRPSEYRKLLGLMVEDWRQHWGKDDLPFVICQLPDIGQRTEKPGAEEDGWVLIREAQQKAAIELSHVSTVNLLDTCEDGELHPRNKQEVGRRAALMALANVNGDHSVVACGPMYEAMTLKGNKAVIKFKNADGGLVVKKLPATYKVNLTKPELGEKPLVLPSPNSEVQGFAIYGAAPLAEGGTSNQWVWADAKIVSDSTVEVSSDKVIKPMAVRYAWEQHPVCNLCNKAGLPAYQFRTDKFPTGEAVKK